MNEHTTKFASVQRANDEKSYMC